MAMSKSVINTKAMDLLNSTTGKMGDQLFFQLYIKYTLSIMQVIVIKHSIKLDFD